MYCVATLCHCSDCAARNPNVMQQFWPYIGPNQSHLCELPDDARTFSNQLGRFRMSKKGKKNLSGGMAGLSLEDGGSDGSDEELEQVEVR